MSLISEASAFDSVTLSAFESADLKWAYVPNAKSVSSEARMALVRARMWRSCVRTTTSS